MSEDRSGRREKGQLSVPGSPEKVFGFPENLHLLPFEGFHGLDTKPVRAAILDQQFSWCDNFMPLGENNLRTLYDVGAPIYTATTGNSLAATSPFYFSNIADTPIMVVFESDGKVMQVNTVTLSQTSMGLAGTILNPSTQRGVAQWGSQYTLICAPQTNGYFIWDGTVFYQAGGVGPSVVISNGGLDYTSQPTIQTYGGHGSGASFTAVLQSGGFISQINVTAAGTGYTAIDGPVYLAFNGGGSTQSAVGLANITNGTVSSITVLVSGSGYNPVSVKVQLLGGDGTGATATASSGVQANGSITQVVVTNSGAGYTSAPTVIFTDALNPVAQATVVPMPFGVQGTSIETFTQRVWITNGAAPTTPPPKSDTVFSAPNGPADFSTADGAGAFIETSSFLRVGYHGLREDNGFLYLLGDSCVNYISGVTTSGNPAITTFNKQNVDPQVGTPWPDTVKVYARSVTFANTFGVHALYGGAVQKVSSPLDGIYPSIAPVGESPTINGIEPSAAVAILFGIHVYMLLLPVVDTFTGIKSNKLMMWDGQKWWTAQPSKVLTFINNQEINSVLTAYGSDGTSIYPLFATPSISINKVAQSKIWDRPGYFMLKNAKQMFGMLKSNDNNAVSLTLSVDTENGTQSQVTLPNLFIATWINQFGSVVLWTATGGAGVTWQASGLAVFGPFTVQGQGKLMGITVQTTATDVTLISATLIAEQYKPNL